MAEKLKKPGRLKRYWQIRALRREYECFTRMYSSAVADMRSQEANWFWVNMQDVEDKIAALEAMG